jgi:hypothetical protein
VSAICEYATSIKEAAHDMALSLASNSGTVGTLLITPEKREN